MTKLRCLVFRLPILPRGISCLLVAVSNLTCKLAVVVDVIRLATQVFLGYLNDSLPSARDRDLLSSVEGAVDHFSSLSTSSTSAWLYKYICVIII